jgi:cytochrome c oxidase subunit 3
MRVTPFDNSSDQFRAGRLGMWLLLLALGLLFASGLVGYLVMRIELRRGWPELPPLPRGLWISTAMLIVSSGSMQWAVLEVRRQRALMARLAMMLTIALGVAFLGLQAVCWIQWYGELIDHWSPEEAFRFALAAFYVFTGLHAAHVIGGLVPMIMVTARLRAPSAATLPVAGAGVEYCAMYWHFLDAVWVALFVTLQLGA